MEERWAGIKTAHKVSKYNKYINGEKCQGIRVDREDSLRDDLKGSLDVSMPGARGLCSQQEQGEVPTAKL